MQGVEILTMTEITEYPEIGTTIATVLAILFLAGLVFILGDRSDTVCSIIGAVLVIVSIIGFVVVLNKYPEQSTGRYKYEAVIDDDVNIQDVYEKYKVIEKDGKKWILEDKEK